MLRKRTVQLFLPLVREMFPDGVEMRNRWGAWAKGQARLVSLGEDGKYICES